RRRLFGTDTSVLMTSATLAMSAGHGASSNLKIASSAQAPARPPATLNTPLGYFATRVGAEGARLLQVGSPFDYEQQMKSFLVNKMPDPREAGYCDALIRWIEHFVKMSHGKAFVLFTNFKLMLEVAERMERFFAELRIECFVQGKGIPRSLMLD